jgi:hypothetical protein
VRTEDARVHIAFPHGLECFAVTIEEHMESAAVVIAALLALYETSRGIGAF